MTTPAGTVGCDVVVTTPTFRPAPASVEAAFSCVLPITFGTVTEFDPSETVIVMGDPRTALAPTFGDCAITWPAGAGFVVNAIDCRKSPMVEIAVCAAACVCPTTFGTVTMTGPLDTTKLTGVPGSTTWPPSGFWPMTFPAG